MRFWVLLLAALLGPAVLAWGPSDVLRRATSPNSLDATGQALLRQIDDALAGNLTYWADRGMPQPKPIDAVVYIDSYETTSLLKVVQALNPDIADLPAHMAQQYEHFKKSDLFRVINQVESRTGKRHGTYTDSFFDEFACMRYGFPLIRHFRQHLADNVSLATLVASNGLGYTNAEFSFDPKVDLTEILDLDSTKRRNVEIALDLVDGKPLEDILLELIPHRLSKRQNRRILVYPNAPGTRGPNLSILQDASVVRHELGHAMVRTLVMEALLGGISHSLDEVAADYLATSETDDPVLGVFFAKQHREVAEILRQTARTFEQRMLVEGLLRVAKQGFIRDMREKVSIDELARLKDTNDIYQTGRPLRGFLWQLRGQHGAAVVDRLLVKAISDTAGLPSTVTENALREILLRQKFADDREHKAWEKIRATVTDDENPTDKATLDELVAKRVELENTRDKFEEDVRALRLQRLAEGKTPFRPLVAGDYMIPEFLRALYRVCRNEGLTEVAESVRLLGGKLMNSTPVVIEIAGEAAELVFFRRPEYVNDAAVRTKLADLLRQRHKLQVQLMAWEKVPRLVSRKKTVPAREDYAAALDRLIAFERSGRPSRLDDPGMHPQWMAQIEAHAAEEHEHSSCHHGFRLVGALALHGQNGKQSIPR